MEDDEVCHFMLVPIFGNLVMLQLFKDYFVFHRPGIDLNHLQAVHAPATELAHG